jgi:hypothetical protein
MYASAEVPEDLQRQVGLNERELARERIRREV